MSSLGRKEAMWAISSVGRARSDEVGLGGEEAAMGRSEGVALDSRCEECGALSVKFEPAVSSDLGDCQHSWVRRSSSASRIPSSFNLTISSSLNRANMFGSWSYMLESLPASYKQSYVHDQQVRVAANDPFRKFVAA